MLKFSVLERLILLNVLPQEANFFNFKLLRVVKEELSFTEEENKLLNFRQVDKQTVWDDTVQPKEIVIGEVVTEMIKKALKELDGKEKLTQDHISLYEKFIEN